MRMTEELPTNDVVESIHQNIVSGTPVFQVVAGWDMPDNIH